MSTNPASALTAEELMAWNDKSAREWRSFIAANPDVLDVPCDIYRARTVGELLQHIVAAELRYAERLTNLPATDYSAIPFSNAEEIYSVHDSAMQMLRTLLADQTYDWHQTIEFKTLTAGRRRASRRAVLFHDLLHGMRHYAQLASLVRRAGYSTGIDSDYLLMDSERIE